MTLAAEGGKDKKPVVRLSTFRNAAKHLQKAGDFRPDMLEDQPIRTLIDEITDALMEGVNIGLKDAEIPTEMADRLGRDVFVFSGCKTYHELREASQLLRDDRGRIKPFGKFSRRSDRYTPSTTNAIWRQNISLPYTPHRRRHNGPKSSETGMITICSTARPTTVKYGLRMRSSKD